MTAPQDAPAGPPLGDGEHKTVQQAVFDAVMDHYRMDPEDSDDQDEMGALVLDVMDRVRPIVAALLSSAREEGDARADEAERVAGNWQTAYEGMREHRDRLRPLVDAAAELLAALDEELPMISRPNSRPRRLQAAADRLRHQLQRAQAR